MLQERYLIVALYIACSLFTLMLVVFVFIYVFMYQKKVNKYNLRLREQELRKQYELFNAINEGEEKERKRLSEELHDGIAAKLVGLKMNMEYFALSQDGDGKDHLHKLTGNMDELVNELRELSLNLQPSFIHAKGLEATLHEITDSLNSRGACRYNFFTDLKAQPVPQPLTLQVCRIASELLVNIHKHAQATEASVQVMLTDDMLQIIAEDNGIGIQPGVARKGIGLTNLQNRVTYLKGEMNIDSSDKGTTIIIELNVNA